VSLTPDSLNYALASLGDHFYSDEALSVFRNIASSVIFNVIKV
jgi:hypothetical protein